MNKGKITVRFERSPEPGADLAENPAPAPAGQAAPAGGAVIPLFREDVGGVSRQASARSAAEAEAERIERLIRESETAAGRPAGRGGEAADADDLYGPGEGPEWADGAAYRRMAGRRRKGGIALLLSGLGAILTGVLLGSLVTELFRGEPGPAVPSAGDGQDGPPASVAPLQDHPAEAAPGLQLPSEEAAPAAAGGPRGLIRLPEQTYHVVQNGVFRSRVGAEEAANLLRERGYAGAVESGEQFAVYAGVASARDDALLIARQLEAGRMDVFIKPVELPAFELSADAWPDGAAVLQAFAESRALMDLIMETSLRHLHEASPGALPDGEWRELEAAHRRWTERANGLPEPADAEAARLIRDAGRAADSAMAAMEQYAKKPSAAYLWQAQAAMLDHLIARKQALDMLAARQPPAPGPAPPAGHPA